MCRKIRIEFPLTGGSKHFDSLGTNLRFSFNISHPSIRFIISGALNRASAPMQMQSAITTRGVTRDGLQKNQQKSAGENCKAQCTTQGSVDGLSLSILRMENRH